MSVSTPNRTVVAPANRWAVLALLGIAQLMVVLDATIVNIALPSAQRALHFSTDSRQWVVTAYALAFGSLLLLGGKLGDLFGRKWTLIGGLSGFAVASAIGGLAQSFGMLVAARALQGAFGAILAPSALGLLTVTFQGSPDRPKAFGIFSAIAAGGASVGLLLGGVLTQAISWRWSLYVNLAIAVPTAIVALRLLRNERQPARAPIDLPGVALASGGLFALVYGFSNAETTSWTDPVTIIALGLSATLLVGFIALERRVEHPLLPLHIVWDRARGGAYATIALAGSAVFAVFLFLTYYLQQNLGYSPLKTGLAFLPMTVMIVLTATTVQTRVLPRTGAKPLVVTGMTLGIIAMILFTQLTAHGAYVEPRPARPPAYGRGDGLHLRARLLHRHAGSRESRRRHRLRHGQHLPAGRRFGRHCPAEHHLRQRRRQLRLRPRQHRRSRRRGLDPRLHDRVRVGSRAVRSWTARGAADPSLRWRQTCPGRAGRSARRPDPQLP